MKLNKNTSRFDYQIKTRGFYKKHATTGHKPAHFCWAPVRPKGQSKVRLEKKSRKRLFE